MVLGQLLKQGGEDANRQWPEEVVLVFMDRATRKSEPLSEKLLTWPKENGATPK